MTTTGDQIQSVSLSKIGSKALFTKELEVALHEQTVDLVVHSLKDIPTELPEGMCIYILERTLAHDVVVSNKGTLEQLSPDASVGTSSVRRISQLRVLYPHLKFADIRGNLNTRLRKLDAGDYDAIILAYAGIERLGWKDRISQHLDSKQMLHAVGQGALAVECRIDDTAVRAMLEQLQHEQTLLKCLAERSFMRRLQGGCSVPLGVYTELVDDELRMIGCVTGSQKQIRAERKCTNVTRQKAEELGIELADELLKLGATEILAEIRK
jgi:hydroxymethylbilane synthase